MFLANRRACSAGFLCRAHTFPADPLSEIALWNNPKIKQKLNIRCRTAKYPISSGLPL